MIANENKFRLVLSSDWSERDALEVRSKGWFQANVLLPDNRQVTVSFFDPARLTQEIGDALSNGQAYFAEINLVVVPEVTLEAINDALVSMSKSDYSFWIDTE